MTRCFIQGNNSDPTAAPRAASPPNEKVLEAVGEGHSKKLSKHDAAAKMLVILTDKFSALLSLANAHESNAHDHAHKSGKSRFKRDSGAAAHGPDSKDDAGKKKKRSRNIEKIKKINPDYGKGSINPISRLIQIQQAKKESEPVFQLISPANENNITYTNGRKPEFVMQVTITPAQESEPKIQAEGRGSTKKIAKQNAAEAALKLLGYQPTPISPALRTKQPAGEATVAGSSVAKASPASAQNDHDKRVKFNEENSKLLVGNRVQLAGKKDLGTHTFNGVPGSTTAATVPSTAANPTNKLKIRTQAQVHSQDLRKKIQDLHQQQQIKTSMEDRIHSQAFIDPKQFEVVCKLAHDLLEGLKDKGNVNQKDFSNFYTRLAEDVLKKNNLNLSLMNKEDFDEQGFEELALINGGSHVNYKRVLEFLARIMSFKVNYQSLMGVSLSHHIHHQHLSIPKLDLQLFLYRGTRTSTRT